MQWGKRDAKDTWASLGKYKRAKWVENREFKVYFQEFYSLWVVKRWNGHD